MRPAVRSGGGFILSAGGILSPSMNKLPARGAGAGGFGGGGSNKEGDKGDLLLLNSKHVIPSDL